MSNGSMGHKSFWFSPTTGSSFSDEYPALAFPSFLFPFQNRFANEKYYCKKSRMRNLLNQLIRKQLYPLGKINWYTHRYSEGCTSTSVYKKEKQKALLCNCSIKLTAPLQILDLPLTYGCVGCTPYCEQYRDCYCRPCQLLVSTWRFLPSWPCWSC